MIPFPYTVERSKRKNFLITVTSIGTVVIRCPCSVTDADIEHALSKHVDGIMSHIARIKANPPQARKVLSGEDIKRLKADAKAYLPGRVAHWGKIMGVMPDRVKVTCAEKIFGHCFLRIDVDTKEIIESWICFSYRVMLLPEELRDVIVVHELAHMTDIRHTDAFYAVMDKYLPGHAWLAEQVRDSEYVIANKA